MPREDGTTAREHLVKVWRQTRKPPKALAEAEMPEWGAYLLSLFHDLAAGRGSTGFGPSAITWGEMESWLRLRRLHLAGWEIDVLRRLDHAWLQAFAERAG